MALEFFTTRSLSRSISQEIEAFLDSQNTGHPFQFPQWADPHSRLVLRREAGAIQWFANCGTQFPLGTRLRRVHAVGANRGPVCDDLELFRDSLAQLAAQMCRENAAYIDAAPERLPVPEAEHPPLFDGNWTPLDRGRFSMRLDLTKTEEGILGMFRPTTRYKVRKAERAGVTVHRAQEEADVDEFIKLYSQLIVLKRFYPDPPEHLRSITRWLLSEPARGALLLARHDGATAGGAVILRCGKRCWYVWGANERHNHFSAGHLVQWHAILWAKSQGCTEYDFGGYTPGATSGPAFFKEGFGGNVVQFVPVHRAVLHSRYYKLFEAVSGLRRYLPSRQGRKDTESSSR